MVGVAVFFGGATGAGEVLGGIDGEDTTTGLGAALELDGRAGPFPAMVGGALCPGDPGRGASSGAEMIGLVDSRDALDGLGEAEPKLNSLFRQKHGFAVNRELAVQLFYEEPSSPVHHRGRALHRLRAADEE